MRIAVDLWGLALLSGLVGAGFGCAGSEEHMSSSQGNPQSPDTSAEAASVILDSASRPLAAVSRRIVGANRDDPHMVARLAVGMDGILEFYEYAPGEISLSGAGRAGQSGLDAADFDDEDVERIWNTYSGGATPPEALKSAIARQRERASQATASDASAPDSDAAFGGQTFTAPTPQRARTNSTSGEQVASVRQAYVGGYCDTAYFTQPEAPWNSPMGDCVTWDWGECLNNWTGGRNIRSTNVVAYYANSCAKIGTHLFTAKWGSHGGNWTVPEETGRWFRHLADCGFWSCSTATATTVVSDASGDTFHVRHSVIHD